MSDVSIGHDAAGAGREGLRSDLAGALLAVLALLALAASGGFASLFDNNGDSDSLVRMVEVHDLIGGQNWFDLTQYRLGPEGGVLMHWSRLVDAPIAALVLAGRALGLGDAAADHVAATAWPALLFFLCVFLIARIARRVEGPDVALPALVIGAFALFTTGIFKPGAVDHHNAQVALSLAMVLGLVAGSFAMGFMAGCAAAVSLAIGMETAPYVAIGGAVAACLFMIRGKVGAPVAAGFGLGFAIAAGIVFLGTVPLRSWSVEACDAFSIVQAGVAVPAGLGLWLAASLPRLASKAVLRVGACALLGIVVAAIVLTQFPQCLADPYATLDPRLKTFWLDGVVEAQSALALIRNDPAALAVWYATPMLALIVSLWRLLRGRIGDAEIVCALMLAGAFAISLWQVRGAYFSIPLASVLLAAMVARRRAAAGAGSQLLLALAWIVSFNPVWAGAANLIGEPSGGEAQSVASGPAGKCYLADDFLQLAAQPSTTVLAVSNLGPGILRYTQHRALAGPYHRNIGGNLSVLDAFMADAAASEALVRGQKFGIVAVCPGNPETRMLVRAAPGGLLADLTAGRIPGWLEPVGGGSGALLLFRVQ